MTTAAPEELIIGGRYRVIRELGRGGMGSVYEAENLRTRRRVALKTMRPEVSSRAEFVRRFEREAQAGGRLRHPNVIDVLDMGDDAHYGFVYIVQEFLSGGDLARCLKELSILPPHAAIATLLPIMDALGAAHELGIIHRDIKPDNIFLHETPQGVVPKLIDFGIAKFAHSEEELSRTVTGQMVGSPNYVSPEQARGDADVDQRTDVWSLGIVFYKCLSRSLAYSAPTASALVAKIIYEEPTALAQLAPHLPADLVAVVQRAVVKDREQRWPSMRAFADALRGCALWRGVDPTLAQRWIVNVRGETLEALPVATPSLPAPTPAQLAPEHPSGQRSGPWGGEIPAVRAPADRATRIPHMLAGVLALLSLGIATTAAVLWPRRPAAPEPTAAVLAPSPAATAPSPPTPTPAPTPAPVAAPVAPLVDASAPAPVAVYTLPPIQVVEPTTPERSRRQPAPAARPTPADPPRRGRNGALIMR
nr:serine/threonine protein kinase [Deltaproteobacteria bacterium]